ncbi:TetR family transcriptional regulator [Gordonia sp. ABSL1-1]|uniref:TetR/AcrR family transcriptional regulator n=1 Tax=Gordonia sp. ABSL1-1 TaxID=3053923 RepID=UPI002573DF94|nr:TetR family transcriptional regulator [Gordonia sp. ABSL1-1]MDL9936959.1 TetR family transcriptional regulator [Gordonia sp. ABSL1-1]
MTTGEAPPLAPGLRERKKQQTRDRLISEALRLCDEQGFDQTTVEEIAEAANVSPRTFNRYFSTKEDVVLAPSEDMINVVTEALRAQPDTGDELDALINAHRVVFTGAADRGLDMTAMQTMNRIMQTSPTVNARGRDVGEQKMAAIAEVIAERLGTTPDDIRVRVVVSTWSSLMHLALERWECGDAFSNASAMESIEETFAAFRTMNGR